MLKRLSTYTTVSIMGFFIKISIVGVLKELLNMMFFIAYGIALGCSILFAFYFHKNWTFGYKLTNKESFHKYYMYSLCSNGVSYGLVNILVGIFNIHYLPSIFIVTSIIGTINFVVSDSWIF